MRKEKILFKFLNVRLKRKGSFFLILSFCLFSQTSCTSTKCVLCEYDENKLYNVELNDAPASIGKTTFQTYFPPVLLERKKDKNVVYVIDCDEKEPFMFEGEKRDQFIKSNVRTIKPGQIKRITTTSGVDVAPEVYTPEKPKGELACNRYRNAVKFETRAMFGVRPPSLTEKSIVYNEVGGAKSYERKFSSIGSLGDPNGTILTMGIEAAMLPRFFKINDRHSLNIGPMVGLWPVDGGLYLPVSIHPRFTINDITAPLWRNCNAWYIFGDLGTAYDLLQNIPLRNYDGDLSSVFWGIGFGLDLWKKKGMDLSFDIGYRYTSMALPQNDDYINCLDDNGMSTEVNNPVRSTDQFFVRIGFTW